MRLSYVLLFAAVGCGTSNNSTDMKIAADLATDASAGATSSDGATDASSGDLTTSQCGVVPSTFMCVAFSQADIPSAGSSCTNDVIHQYVEDCWDPQTASPTACATWAPNGMNGSTSCGACLNAWLATDGTPNTLACEYMFAGGSDLAQQMKCRDALKCVNDCGNTACNLTVCDNTMTDQNGQTAYTRCLTSDLFSTNGACATPVADGTAVGTTIKACTSAMDFRAQTQNCTTSSVKATEIFFRGACRDNGVWTSAGTPPP